MLAAQLGTGAWALVVVVPCHLIIMTMVILWFDVHRYSTSPRQPSLKSDEFLRMSIWLRQPFFL